MRLLSYVLNRCSHAYCVTSRYSGCSTILSAQMREQAAVLAVGGVLGAQHGAGAKFCCTHALGMIILPIFVSVTRASAKRTGTAARVSPTGRSRQSDSHAAAPVLFAHAHSALATLVE